MKNWTFINITLIHEVRHRSDMLHWVMLHAMLIYFYDLADICKDKIVFTEFEGILKTFLTEGLLELRHNRLVEQEFWVKS
jgi:hypothetical protein